MWTQLTSDLKGMWEAKHLSFTIYHISKLCGAAGGKGCHPQGLGKTWQVGPCKLHKVQRGQVHGWGNPKHKCRLGGKWMESHPWRGLEVVGWQEAWQYVPVALKSNSVLSCIKTSGAGTFQTKPFYDSMNLWALCFSTEITRIQHQVQPFQTFWLSYVSWGSECTGNSSISFPAPGSLAAGTQGRFWDDGAV